MKTKLLALVAMLGGVLYWLYPDRYPSYPASDHYDPNTQTFFNPQPSRPLEKWGTMQALWQMVAQAERFAPSQPLPTEQPDWKAFLAPSDHAKFIWLGHSTLLVRINNQTILIDPIWAEYASPVPIMAKRFQPAPISLSELPNIDAIIYSHNHYDHLDKAVVAHFHLQNIRFFVPLAMGVLLQKWGVPAENITELDWWQSLDFNGIQLTAVPARHNTGRGAFDSNKTFWAGYVLKSATEQIYYSGDSAYMGGEHFRQIGKKFGGFDLAFIENGQYNPAWIDNHMLPEQTVQASLDVKAKLVVPVHWGAYTLAPHKWNEPVRQSVPKLRQQGIDVLTPKLGQLFDQQTQTSDWWQTIQ